MPSHKFHIGDSVMLKPAISRNVPGGVYEVIKQLPTTAASMNTASKVQMKSMSGLRGNAN